ncbi:MAG: hypothetical protein KA354_23590 [Phycisphaerae bacterium]|nr:hypothetical protein [Phycisphaerae bacterium]
MQPCQQCSGGSPISVWISALLIVILLIAWQYWPRMGRLGRIAIVMACIAVLGGSIATSHWWAGTGSTSGTCGTCLMPVSPSPAPGPAPATRPATQPAGVTTTVASQPSGESSAFATSPEVVAFYCHRTVRCHTCLQIEEWANQAIETHFAGELGGGLIEWRPINIEEPGNEHFEKDYELTAQSLVLVRMRDGKLAEWKNLKSVWELVGDYGGFTEYVRTELSSFLSGASGM